MRTAIFLVVGLFCITTSGFAQVSPRPVADAEIRDGNSTRMRSLQLERVKRDSKKIALPEASKEQIVKLGEIKDDFENIQKLQDKIVKTYTTGKTINYSKIGESAANMTKKAIRLDTNLFGAEPVKLTDLPADVKSKSVRTLIIELDRAIGTFVKSPIFESGKLVDLNVSAKSDLDLRRIIFLSEALSREAKKRP